MMSRRKVAGVIRSFANARSLQLDCARVLHEILPVPVLIYSSETSRSRGLGLGLY